MKLDKRSIIVFNKFAESIAIDVENLKEFFPDLLTVSDLKVYNSYIPPFEDFCKEDIKDLEIFLVEAKKWADDNLQYYDEDGNITKKRIKSLREQMGEQFNKDINVCLQKDLPFLYKYREQYDDLVSGHAPIFAEFIEILCGFVEVPGAVISNEDDSESLVEEISFGFLKKNFPEYFDKECEWKKKLESPIPAIKREAVRGLLVNLGFITGSSVSTVSMEECSVNLLRHVIETELQRFLNARKSLDFEYKLPEHFYVALEHRNLPKEVFVQTMKAVEDNSWIKELICNVFERAKNITIYKKESVFRSSVSRITEETQKNADIIAKENETKAPEDRKPKPIKRVR